jgi:hypothetical protein
MVRHTIKTYCTLTSEAGLTAPHLSDSIRFCSSALNRGFAFHSLNSVSNDSNRNSARKSFPSSALPIFKASQLRVKAPHRARLGEVAAFRPVSRWCRGAADYDFYFAFHP